MLLKYVKTRDVEYPSRGHATDAGIDFFVPTISDDFIKDLEAIEANATGVAFVNHRFNGGGKNEIHIQPGSNVLIPSGIKIEVPYGYMGLFLNKSGVASKKDALIGAQVIDTFYSGEVHIDIHNVGSEMLILTEGMKLAQMVMIPVLACDLTLVDEEQLYDWMTQDSVRGAGGFGSTDLKQENDNLRSEISALRNEIQNEHIYKNATGS